MSTMISLRTCDEGNHIVKYASFNDREYWVRFPRECAPLLTNRADPFVIMLIFHLMMMGGDFVFDGDVSRSVLDNMRWFARIWNMWVPNVYKLITINATNVVPDDYRPNNRKLISAFSGGLDAAYTLYKHKKKLDTENQYDLNRAVMIFGMDIPLSAPEQFDVAFANAKKMTDDLGVELIPVSTNFRIYPEHTWDFEFEPVMVGVLNFFAREYFYCAVATGLPAKCTDVLNGDSPIVTQFLSNDTCRFISDGMLDCRTQRAAIIKDWQAGIENLRVCWRNEDKSKNCGICEKCVRTKLNFMAVGCNHVPSMPTDATFEQLPLDGFVADELHLSLYQEIYDYMMENNTGNPQWREFLKSRLDAWRAQINHAPAPAPDNKSWWDKFLGRKRK